MKILYHHRTKSRDGQYIHIQSLIRSFRRAGHEVRELGLAASEATSLSHESRFWHSFTERVPRKILELLEYAYSPPAAIWMWSGILADRPDLLYERYALGNFAGVLAARMARLPIFLEVNSPLALEKKLTGQLQFESMARLSERWILKSATRILVVSGVLKRMCEELGVDPARIEVIPNGIDPTLWNGFAGHGDRSEEKIRAFREKNGLDDATVLGFVGFFREWHRLDLVLSLMAGELSDLPLKLLLIGDGPAREQIVTHSRALGLEGRLVFTGILEPEQVPCALCACDIALQSDVLEYASPLKLFDYMAAGRAIVAPRRPNIREILEEGESGLLFEPGNGREMARAIRRFAADEGLRRSMGAAARRRIDEQGYTWDANAERIQTLFEEVMRCGRA